MIPGPRALKVGTRGSLLALDQTRRAIECLHAVDPERTLAVQVLSTSGDVDKTTPLAIIGGQGIFAKELQSALLNASIDLAVHSAKDLPSTTLDSLTIGAYLDRSDPRDVLVAPGGHASGITLASLPSGARVGTSSRRRVAALKYLRPDLQPVELRGNVDTRLGKVEAGQVDAAILAAAGLIRLGRWESICEFLDPTIFVPAPGQGTLAVECRADDDEVLRLLAAANEPDVALLTNAERAFLRATGGGCRSPIGAFARTDGDQVVLHAMIGSESGDRVLLDVECSLPADAIAMAETLAGRMLAALELEQVSNP